jgi:HUS1 checkpoint protein
MQITHEINVNVLSLKRQGELNEPLCPPPDVSHTACIQAGLAREYKLTPSDPSGAPQSVRLTQYHLKVGLDGGRCQAFCQSCGCPATSGLRAELTKQAGTMELSVRSKNVDLKTTWKKLHIPAQSS